MHFSEFESNRQVSSGTSQTCALLSSGSLKCWGDNNSGQLGDGTNINKNVPTQVSTLTAGVVQVSSGGGSSAGNGHTCAIVSGGVKCWGDNSMGQLGTGTITPSNVPVDVINLP